MNLAGTKEFANLEMGRFRELGRRVGVDPVLTEAIVVGTLDRAATAWHDLCQRLAPSDRYREAMQEHWRRVPILTPYAARICCD